MFDPVLQTNLDPALASLLQSNHVAGNLILQVYRDLILVKRWHKLDIKEFGGTNYIVGVQKEGDEVQVIVPMATSDSVTMQNLTEKIGRIPDPNSADSEAKTISNFTYGIVDTDSTLVYYKIHFDLVPPMES